MDMNLAQIDLDLIDDEAFTTRLGIDDPEFEDLRESIRRDGIIQPVILSKVADRFHIAAGHRRVAAARAAGLKVIPALITDADDKHNWNIAFSENLFRKNLSAIEEAGCIKDCIDSGLYTTETVARMLGRSMGWVLGRLELIAWPNVLTLAVHLGQLSVAAAKWIAKIDDGQQVEMLTDYAVKNGATERATQAWYQSWSCSQEQIQPADIEALPAGERVPLPEPQSPCIICGQVHPMRNLSYLPTCGNCGLKLTELARDRDPVQPAGSGNV